jgi:hypothetical protein
MIALPAQVRQPASGDRISVLRSITVETGETVADVVCFLCSVYARGRVTEDITTFGGGIEINGKAGSDAVAIGGSIHLGPQADVSGDAIAMGGVVKQDVGAQIAGDALPMTYLFFPGQRQPFVLGFLVLLAFNLLLTLIFYLALRQRRVENLAAASRERPVVATIVGLLLFAVCSGLFYAATFLDRALLVVESLLFMIIVAIIMAGFAGLSFGTARRVASAAKPVNTALAGATVLTILEAVPVLGLLVFLVVSSLGAGAVVVTRFGKLGQPVSFETVPPS